VKTNVVVEAKTHKYHLRYLDQLTWAARKNRQKETESEKLLWNEILRQRRLGVKFTRQKPIDRFIVDFYCSELCLAVEIDGESHKEKKERDNQRDKYLKACGIITLRFVNNEVINNLDRVKKKIKEYIQNSLALSREREGPPQAGRDRV